MACSPQRSYRVKMAFLLVAICLAYLLGFRVTRVTSPRDVGASDALVIGGSSDDVIRFKVKDAAVQRYRSGDDDFYRRRNNGRAGAGDGGASGEGEGDRRRNLASEILTSNSVINVVHYLWCERKIFEFQHYLSMVSAIKYVVPERIVFHYAHYPRHDLQFYNTWFEELKKEFPFLYQEDVDKSVCANGSTKRQYVTRLLEAHGGIYVDSNTIFGAFPIELRMWPITDALGDDGRGFLVVRRGSYARKQPVNRANNCTSLARFAHGSVCTTKLGPYVPRDAWNGSDYFSRHVRYLMYGSRTLPRAKPSNETLVPLIGHMLWLGGGRMDFLFYLSCLSQIHILRVDTLYIHGDRKPTGAYWQEIEGMQHVRFVRRTFPDRVFRNVVNKREHMSDVFRLDTMSRYGGIYTDVDAVWVNPIPRRLRAYDAVASYDWPQMYNNYPDYLNLGVMLGKSGAEYWQAALGSMRSFKDDFFGYNGLLRPYKLFERRPDLMHIEDRLQVSGVLR